MSPPLPPLVFPDAAELSEAAARLVRDVARRAILEHGRFRIAFAGGRSPRGLLERLSREPYHEAIDWSRVQVLQVDERAVPPDHPDSNYRLLREALLDPLGPEAPLARRMPADAPDAAQAARDYARELETPLDLVVLGLGEDGHIASLFPGSPLIADRERRVAVLDDSPKPPPRRMTLMPRALLEARSVVVLATGAAKHEAAQAALAPNGDASRSPARLLPEAVWLLDSAAALGEPLPPPSGAAPAR